MTRDLAVLALPVITGLNGLIWAEVVARSGGAIATLCGALAYVLVALIAWCVGLAPGGRPDLPWLVALIALNTITSTLWLIPLHGGTRYVSLALIEGAWPVFSILFAWLLFRRMELDAVSAIGGGLIMGGAALVYHRS